MTINQAVQAAARERAYAMPLADVDPCNVDYFEDDTVGHYFERLRREDPVHMAVHPLHGPYWSITRYQDIMSVDTNHQVFSSDWSLGGITITDEKMEEARLQMFIAMDPPKHDVQRKAVTGIVAPSNLANMEALIRERTIKVLESLPRGEAFDWVDKVSIELTTLMLATLFDFPLEDRRLLTHWSNVATSSKLVDPDAPTPEERLAELHKMLAYFTRLWNERVNAEPGHDLVSMLAHNPATRNMGPAEYMGNLVLLIVGGNDTTRNSMTGGLLAMSQNPGEWQKFRDKPELIPNMVSEIIRWQTPLAHMRRTATQDTELNGKTIKKGDKVVMWYLSGNRDDSAIANPEQFLIDRPQARQHLSFGFGIHRCVGNRLAEMQLRILWEEIHKRFPVIEVLAPPKRVRSTFVRGYSEMQVRIPV
ncbi:cytochrome P450 [Comamonas serinivorans]|uniref:Cytochrome P450 n=1 Tax=Comamonas serinivorans TaxID=1082851 RepID=A0A1Y0EKC9_9BURK|nr:cytochrome P450 [Comamonas serinivorans]ARU03742.1 cytochrome P450 [Comamonas serinivorans]